MKIETTENELQIGDNDQYFECFKLSVADNNQINIQMSIEAIGQDDKCKEIISNYEQSISNEIDYYDNKHNKYNDKLTKTKLIQEKLNQLKSSD